MTPSHGSILLADDEEKILKRLGRALRDEGHEVVEVTTAREAQRHLAERPFDLLVVDNVMPGMTGLELDARALAAAGGGTPADSHDDGARIHPDRARGVQARRRGLPREAVRDRRTAGAGPPRSQEPAPADPTPVSDQRARRRVQLLRHRRPEPRDGGSDPARRTGRADQEHRADHRRDRYRQGDGRAADPSPQRAARHAADQGELRGDSRDAARIRAIRPRPRRLYRRDHDQARQVRAGRRRLDLSRRNRDAHHLDPVEAAACAAGARVRAARRRADPAR